LLILAIKAEMNMAHPITAKIERTIAKFAATLAENIFDNQSHPPLDWINEWNEAV
jgi:hypothetical protein